MSSVIAGTGRGVDTNLAAVAAPHTTTSTHATPSTPCCFSQPSGAARLGDPREQSEVRSTIASAAAAAIGKMAKCGILSAMYGDSAPLTRATQTTSSASAWSATAASSSTVTRLERCRTRETTPSSGEQQERPAEPRRRSARMRRRPSARSPPTRRVRTHAAPRRWRWGPGRRQGSRSRVTDEASRSGQRQREEHQDRRTDPHRPRQEHAHTRNAKERGG